jgi:hypothetical protein
MFRGSLWLQRHGRDWSLAAFLSTGRPTSAAELRQALTDPAGCSAQRRTVVGGEA